MPGTGYVCVLSICEMSVVIYRFVIFYWRDRFRWNKTFQSISLFRPLLHTHTHPISSISVSNDEQSMDKSEQKSQMPDGYRAAFG